MTRSRASGDGAGGVRRSTGWYRPPTKPFAVLATTLCRTSINSLPYFSKLFAVLASVCGKGFVRTRQRAQCPTAKNRTVSPKGTSGLGQSAAQTSPKSLSDRHQVPVGLASKARQLVLETLRAIDSEPSGHWRQAVGLLETSRRAFAANLSGYWIKAVGLSLDYSFSIVRDDLSLATETFAVTYRAFGRDLPRPLPRPTERLAMTLRDPYRDPPSVWA